MPTLFSHNHPIENLHFSEKLQAFKPSIHRSEDALEGSFGWVQDHTHAIDIDFTDLKSALEKIIYPEIEPATAPAASISPAANHSEEIED